MLRLPAVVNLESMVVTFVSGVREIKKNLEGVVTYISHVVAFATGIKIE